MGRSLDTPDPAFWVLGAPPAQMLPWAEKKLDCRKKNDTALSSLKTGAPIRAEIPNSWS